MTLDALAIGEAVPAGGAGDDGPRFMVGGRLAVGVDIGGAVLVVRGAPFVCPGDVVIPYAWAW